MITNGKPFVFTAFEVTAALSTMRPYQIIRYTLVMGSPLT